MKKAAAGDSFPGFGAGPKQAFCGSVYTSALLVTIVFGGIGISAAHENSPGMKRGLVSHRGYHAER